MGGNLELLHALLEDLTWRLIECVNKGVITIFHWVKLFALQRFLPKNGNVCNKKLDANGLFFLKHLQNA